MIKKAREFWVYKNTNDEWIACEYKKNDPGPFDSFILVREVLPNEPDIIFQRDEYKRLAKSWMDEYDKLKEKYEPLIAVPCHASPDYKPLAAELAAALEIYANRYGYYDEPACAQKALINYRKATE